MKCQYCGELCKSKISFCCSHLKFCKEHKNILNSLTKEKLYELYIDRKMSALDIKKLYNLYSISSVYKKLKEYNIKKSFSDAATHCMHKREETNLKETGYKHNFCKNSPSRKKWEQRLFEEEGIINVFQREEVKDKIYQTYLKKYGEESPYKIYLSRGKCIFTKIHKKIIEILQKHNIQLSIEYKISREKPHRYYSYDIICYNNKIIEVYGDYWHGNPEIYKEEDLILKGSIKEISVKEKWKLDKDKVQFAKDKGYDVLIIWEKDMNTDIKKVEEIILEYLNENIKN